MEGRFWGLASYFLDFCYLILSHQACISSVTEMIFNEKREGNSSNAAAASLVTEACTLETRFFFSFKNFLKFYLKLTRILIGD